MDDRETMAKFKASLKAPFIFVPDPDGKVVKLYDVKMPAVSYAKRTSFVVGQDQKIVKVQSGQEAIDPGDAITACPIKKKGSTPNKKPS